MNSKRKGKGPALGEEGAVLVLALVFIVAVGLVLAALATSTESNLMNTSNLQYQRNVEFAADSTVDGAIQTLRHQAPVYTAGVLVCPTFPDTPSPSLTVNGMSFEVQCQMSISALDPYGRNVEFDACRARAGLTFLQCQTSAIARVEVVYDDVASTDTSGTPCTSPGSQPGCYGSSWGSQMTIWSWVVRTANG